jgi:hypothetical protein
MANLFDNSVDDIYIREGLPVLKYEEILSSSSSLSSKKKFKK